MLKVFEENKELSRVVTADAITLCNLYELEYSNGKFLRYIASNRELSYNGNLYLPSAIKHSDFSQDDSGKIGDINLTVGNADRAIQYYINEYDLVGKKVKITQIFFGKAKDAVEINTTDLAKTDQIGNWQTESVPESRFGSSLYGEGSCSFSWKASLNGEQEVAVYYPETESGVQSKNAKYEVYSNDILIDTVILDQTQNHGIYTVLGTYEFDMKAEIKLIGELAEGEVVTAAAVRFFGASGIDTVVGEVVNSFAITSIVAKKDYAVFTLSIGLDALQLVLPSRRIFSNSCSWTFRDDDCKYSGDDTTCAKTFDACRSKGHTTRFGGFPGVINERLYI